jgi:hypothetical protein
LSCFFLLVLAPLGACLIIRGIVWRKEVSPPPIGDHIPMAEGRFHQPHVIIRVPGVLHVNGQPLLVVEPYEQLHVPRLHLHPLCSEPDDGEYLLGEGRQSCTGHDRYLLDSVRTDHLDVAIRVHEGHVVHTVREGAHSLIALDGLPRDPHTL